MSEILNNIVSMARRFKTATALNLIGLVLAFVTFYMIMTQIIYQSTFNHAIHDYQRIYRLECSYLIPELGFSDHLCRPFAEALDSLPQVESYSLISNYTNAYMFKKGDILMPFDVTYGNDQAISAISGEPLSGSIEWTPEDKDGYIIPAGIAMAYFGTTKAAGDSIILVYAGEDYPVLVRGVYQDFPDNSEFGNYIYMNYGGQDKSSLNFIYQCYIKFKTPLKDSDAYCATIKDAVVKTINQDTTLAQKNNEHDLRIIKQCVQETDFKLTPLKKSFFEESSFSSTPKGFSWMLYFLILASILVIVIGTINFLNCALVESPMRVKSINTRLVLGAARSQLRLQLVGESVITSVAACLVALALCQLIAKLPSIHNLLNGSITLCNHKGLVAAMIAISVVLGLIAGWYPAKFATSFQPAIALKTSFGLTRQGIKLRNILLFFQLLVSMIMVMYISILFTQSRYIFNSDYGFDKDQIIMAELPADLDTLNKKLIYQELVNLPQVEGVSFSNSGMALDDIQDLVRTDINGEPFMFRKLHVDSSYLRVMGIEMVEGRSSNQSGSTAMIVNENARDKMKIGTKFSIDIGAQLGDSISVIGYCNNFRYGTMRTKQDSPFAIVVDNNSALNYLNIRIAADANRSELLKQISEIIIKHTDSDTSNLTPFDESLYETYQYEMLYFRQSYTTSFVCILLTLFGLFCLTMFETEYRRKEIGIRKVAGATTGEIIKMLNKHYAVLILISFAIALPIAWMLGRTTLNHFAEHATISWWIYPLGLLLGGGVTLATVMLQSWRAARENPVNSIKTE